MNTTESLIHLIDGIQQIRGEDDYSVFHECEAVKKHLRSDTKLQELIDSAKAVIERWDSPKWSDGTHTADYIHRLRRAAANMEKL